MLPAHHCVEPLEHHGSVPTAPLDLGCEGQGQLLAEVGQVERTARPMGATVAEGASGSVDGAESLEELTSLFADGIDANVDWSPRREGNDEASLAGEL